MYNLSIVIKGEEENIRKNIEMLEHLLNCFDTELILINNHIDALDIPYDYRLHKFAEGCGSFRNYCFTISLGKKIMIIDKNITVTEELVNSIKNNLDEDDYLNLSCNMKTYLNKDKSLYFTSEQVLVYTRGVKGFNKNLGVTIENTGLLENNEDSIYAGIDLLISGKYFNELFSWYEKHILKTHDILKSKFYITIENKKVCMDDYEAQYIDDLFLASKYRNRYMDYLELRRLWREYKEKNSNHIIERIKCIRFSERFMYYSWLLRPFITENKNGMDFLKALDLRAQEMFILHLIKNDASFYEYMYDFIIDVHENDRVEVNSRNALKTYLNVMKVFMEYLKTKDDDYFNKRKLFTIFELYVHYSMALCNYYPQNNNDVKHGYERLFISQFHKVYDLIESNSIEQALAVFKKLECDFPEHSAIIRYYIKRLNYENKYYPYILSICMIVRDEEKNLDRCLSSLKALADCNLAEIIIVDTGSKDNTIEIAKAYTDKIFSHPWNHDFSEARNYSISLAEGEYVFIMDADEEFKVNDIEKLINEFSDRNFRQYKTFKFKTINYTDKDLKEFTMMTQPRIFANNGLFHYFSTVHNQPVYDNPVKNLDIEIFHYGYIMTEDIKEKKFQRTSSLLIKELEKNPRNIYNRYQLSASYGMHGDMNEATKQVDIYMRIIKEDGIMDDTVMQFYNYGAYIYMENYRYDEAMELCNKSLSLRPDYIDFIFYKAYLLYRKENYAHALLYITKYIDIMDNYYKVDTANDGRYNFHTLCLKDDAAVLLILSSYMVLCLNLVKNGMGKFLKESKKLLYGKIFSTAGELISENTSDGAKTINHSAEYSMEKDIQTKIYINEYISNLKNKIAEASIRGETGKILELFHECDKESYYDAELYVIKSVLLMAENMHTEAADLIEKGLKRFPGDFYLLSNLCSVYILKNNHKKAWEIFYLLKMQWPSQDISGINNILSQKPQMHDEKDIRVLHGTIDLSCNTMNMAKALKARGISARVLNYASRNNNYNEDYIMNANLFECTKKRVMSSIDAASMIIPGFDIFHFHYGSTLTFNYCDLQLLNELKKTVFMHFWGQEIRIHSISSKLNPYSEIDIGNDDNIKRKLSFMSKYISCCIVRDYEVFEYVRGFFSDIKLINPMVDLNKYAPANKMLKKDVFTIVHTPGSLDMKDTKIIENAIDDLKQKYSIDFKIIKGLLNDEIIRTYGNAHLIIDRLLVGSYGQFSIEAMAMGKPVICWISDFMKDKYPKDLPIINGSIENIKEKIEYAIKNRDMLQDLGQKGRLYVEKYHDINKETDKIIQLYKSY